MLRVMNRRAMRQTMWIGLLGCATALYGADKAKIKLDGKETDWKSVKPVIEDARSPKMGKTKEIDVHQLKAWHDDKYLYLYVSTTVPPKDSLP